MAEHRGSMQGVQGRGPRARMLLLDVTERSGQTETEEPPFDYEHGGLAGRNICEALGELISGNTHKHLKVIN